MTTITDHPTPNFSTRLYGITIIVAAIVFLSLWLMTRYVALDVERDMRNWQEKLNLIAESRKSDIDNYIADHFKELRALSENPSLQLYLTELQMLPPAVTGKTPPVEPAELSYLRNLLIFTAQRSGYIASINGSTTIPANVESDNKSALAVLNKDNELVVSTNMPASMKELILQQAAKVALGKDNFIDINKDEAGNIYMGFAVPIYAIQGESNANSQIGKVIGIKSVDAAFFDRLKHPGITEKTLESVLVRADGNKIEFLNPLLDQSAALTKQIDKDGNKFVEAHLMITVGNFISDMKDYGNKKVLATSREISNTPWVMVVKVERSEALTQSNQRRNSMLAFFFLMVVIIVLIIIAIWWHATSRRSLMLSHHFRKLAARSMAQEKLLRLVSDNQPEAIFILDQQGHYRFTNKQAADEASMHQESMIGKDVKDVRGTARASHIMEHLAEAMTLRQVGYHVFQHEDNGKMRTIQGAYVPVDAIPISGMPAPTPGVLVVEQDITEVVYEREKRLQISQDLIHTLLKLVDQRDPFSANHSLLVSYVAQQTSMYMELDAITIDTARIAASLMNLGKIVVPVELLTKTEPLNDKEKQIVRDSMNDAAELIKPIHFDGPVYETLREWQERYDGTGPLGFKGEAILISARVVAVANTFIGMISPRSWRDALSIDSAIKFLMNNCDTLFDRKVVVSLAHYVENQQGREWLSQVLSKKDAA